MGFLRIREKRRVWNNVCESNQFARSEGRVKERKGVEGMK